jgi:RND family efflux transporter MFP subunit
MGGIFIMISTDKCKGFKHNWIRYCACLLFVLMVMSLIGGCGSKEKAIDSAKESKFVQLAQVSSLSIENRTDLASLLEPSEETLAAFEVGGRVMELFFEEGNPVGVGARLARLDASEYGIQHAQSKVAVDNAQVAYEQALDFYTRVKSLYEAGGASKSDFEKARDGLTMTENERQLAQQSYDLVNGKDWLSAPIKGVVLNKLVSVGQLVSPGTPAYRIGQIDELKILLPVPDYEIKQWKTDDIVTLTLYGESREGKVTKVHPTTNKGTGTVGVEVRIANPQHDWLPGQMVQVSRKLNGEKATFVPVQSVLNRGEKNPYVYVAIDGKAIKRPVVIGRISGQYLEISSGLNLGEQVVSRGADRLFNGDLIQIGGNGE